MSYLNGGLGSYTCCLSSSRTHLEEKGVRIGLKGRDRRRFNRCASESHHQINGIPLMVGRWCAEVNRNHVNALISLHLSHRCRFLSSVSCREHSGYCEEALQYTQLTRRRQSCPARVAQDRCCISRGQEVHFHLMCGS